MPDSASYSVGIDLGGSVIKAIAADARGGVLERQREPTRDGVSTVDDWVRAVRGILEKIEGERGGRPCRVGIAAPGLAARDGRCIAHLPGKLQGLEGLVWGEVLDHPEPVTVHNDAHAALLGEAWVGEARGCSDAVLLTLGTGVGGAVLAEGRLLKGAIGRAGHLGHLCLDPDDARKSIVGMPGALEVRVGDYTVRERSGGRFASTEALVKASDAGDPQARELWWASIRALGCAIASFINLFDPERVILAGGLTKAGPALLQPLEDVLNEVEWRPDGHRTPVVLSRLGEWAGALGMASLPFVQHD